MGTGFPRGSAPFYKGGHGAGLWYVHGLLGSTSSPADGPAGVWPVSSPSSVDLETPCPQPGVLLYGKREQEERESKERELQPPPAMQLQGSTWQGDRHL